jgi:hypothetical protein
MSWHHFFAARLVLNKTRLLFLWQFKTAAAALDGRPGRPDEFATKIAQSFAQSRVSSV